MIFVEGDSEDISFPILFQALGYNQIGKQIRVFNLKNQGNIKKIKHFLLYLKEFGTNVFIVMDQNKVSRYELDDFVRERLLKERHYMIWPRDFEDMFESEAIIEAMNRVSLHKNFAFDLPATTLEAERKTRGVVSVLKEYMYSKNNSFKKTDLALELANSFALKIYSEKRKKETNIEKHIHQIWKSY